MQYSKFNTIVLIGITFIVGLCSLAYELLISTISSYFLGDSVTQFSLTIGVYLASMGIGSYFTRYVTKCLASTFIFVELLLALIGGLSIPLAYFYFAFADSSGYQLFILSLTGAIGFLTGFEIPLITRI